MTNKLNIIQQGVKFGENTDNVSNNSEQSK